MNYPLFVESQNGTTMEVIDAVKALAQRMRHWSQEKSHAVNSRESGTKTVTIY